MIVLDKSKLEDLKKIEKVMENKTYEEDLIYYGVGTQARIYVTDDWEYVIKLYHQEEDIEEIEEINESNHFDDSIVYICNPEEFYQQEVEALKVLNEAGCSFVPTLYGYKEGRYIVKEFVSGSEYDEYCALNHLFFDEDEGFSKEEDEFLAQYNEQMNEFKSICDKLNIIPIDCAYDGNVIINDEREIRIIDLGSFEMK